MGGEDTLKEPLRQRLTRAGSGLSGIKKGGEN